MLVLMAFGYAPIAWGKPVPINPAYMKGGRRGAALATVAGPLSNIIFALVVALILRLTVTLAPDQTVNAMLNNRGFTSLVNSLLFINIILAAFNLIPLPPLDGFGILEGLAPPEWDRFLVPIRQYGMWILLLLVLGGGMLGRFNPLYWLMNPLIHVLSNIVLAVSGL